MSKVVDTIDPNDVEEIVGILTQFNEANSDVGNWHQKVFVVRDEQQVAAGIVFNIHWYWLHIDVLAVQPSRRCDGLGRRLLKAAEAYAKAQGCVGAYLDTMSFQAPGFYAKHGYEVLATLEGLPRSMHKVYLFKRF